MLESKQPELRSDDIAPTMHGVEKHGTSRPCMVADHGFSRTVLPVSTNATKCALLVLDFTVVNENTFSKDAVV